MASFISRVNVLDKGFVELLNYMGSDLDVVDSARVSFLGEAKGTDKDKKLLEYLLRNGHSSPFEHVMFRFRVKCPIFIARQWHRHRTWSYNEVSRRYTSEDIDFYIPTEFRKQSENNRQASLDEKVETIFDGYCDAYEEDYKGISVKNYLDYICKSAYEYYQVLIGNGVAREQARMVLPQNTYTMFYASVDLHNLLHFLDIRDSEHAQHEMRLYAKAIKKLIEPCVPWTLEIVERIKNETVRN